MLHSHRVSYLMLEQSRETAKREARRGSHRNNDDPSLLLLRPETRATPRTRGSRHHDNVPQPTNAKGPKTAKEKPPKVPRVVTRRVREPKAHFLRPLTNCPFLLRLRPFAARFLA